MSDLYIHGAAVLDNVLAQKGSLKGLVMAQSRQSGGRSTGKAVRGRSSTNSKAPEAIDAKRLLALTANTLAFMKPLMTIIEASTLLEEEKRVLTGKNLRDKEGKLSVSARSLALVLAHDLLFSKRARIATSPAWPPHAALQRHAARLRAELVKLQIKEGKTSVQELRAGEATREKVARIPRWVRLNERKGSIENIIAMLQADSWSEVSELTAKAKHFLRSMHVPSVIAFHPSHTSTLLQSKLYKEGYLMLQDLASCFPAEILVDKNEEAEIHAVDATSAPGNKTSHLSARLSRRAAASDVIAMEHMQPRYKTLVEQLRRAGCLESGVSGQVTPKLCDFMKQDPRDYASVTHMLLDPSCSGSGILGRLDFLTDEQEASVDASEASSTLASRLQNLATFQGSMIEHAMQFPALTRLTYSTCSIHHEENEDVVVKALQSDTAKRRRWRMATREQVMPTWPTRGLVEHCAGDQALADAMVRCVPGGVSDTGPELDMDATNGFFVTLFVRDDALEGEDQQAAGSALHAPGSNTEKNRKRKQRAKDKARAEKRSRHGTTGDTDD